MHIIALMLVLVYKRCNPRSKFITRLFSCLERSLANNVFKLSQKPQLAVVWLRRIHRESLCLGKEQRDSERPSQMKAFQNIVK